MAPDADAPNALVATNSDVERGWSVPERFVGKTAQKSIPNISVATTSTVQVISSVGTTFHDSFVHGEVLADAVQVEAVESTDCREVRDRESRLGDVEVFRADCVRTSIIGRLRSLSE